MAQFNLTAKVTISVYTVVEAETLEEAIRIAQDRNIVEYQYGSSDQEKYDWISEEFDGAVFDIEES